MGKKMHAAHGFAAHKRYELPAYNAGLTNEGKPANSRNNGRRSGSGETLFGYNPNAMNKERGATSGIGYIRIEPITGGRLAFAALCDMTQRQMTE